MHQHPSRNIYTIMFRKVALASFVVIAISLTSACGTSENIQIAPQVESGDDTTNSRSNTLLSDDQSIRSIQIKALVSYAESAVKILVVANKNIKSKKYITYKEAVLASIEEDKESKGISVWQIIEESDQIFMAASVNKIGICAFPISEENLKIIKPEDIITFSLCEGPMLMK